MARQTAAALERATIDRSAIESGLATLQELVKDDTKVNVAAFCASAAPSNDIGKVFNTKRASGYLHRNSHA